MRADGRYACGDNFEAHRWGHKETVLSRLDQACECIDSRYHRQNLAADERRAEGRRLQQAVAAQDELRDLLREV